MKRLIPIPTLLFFAISILSANFISNDTINLYYADSLNQYLDLDDTTESNFEANLDSMLNLWYIKQSSDIDSILAMPPDSLIPDFPDSIYIARLAEIPTIINLSYNRIVRNYINAYTQKRRNTVEVMLGLSEYYFPLFDEIFD